MHIEQIRDGLITEVLIIGVLITRVQETCFKDVSVYFGHSSMVV